MDAFGLARGGPGCTAQNFTSSGTWYKPVGCKQILVRGWSGGGGSGGSASTAAGQNSNGAGGGSGGYFEVLYDVSFVSSAVVTIGAGGSAGASTPTDGGSAGNTIWNDGLNSVTILGAGGGQAGTATSGDAIASPGSPGFFGGTISGTAAFLAKFFPSNGSVGGAGVVKAGLRILGGFGAGAPFGAALAGNINNSTGNVGSQPGGGSGAGSAQASSGPFAGAAGGAGAILVLEFY